MIRPAGTRDCDVSLQSRGQAILLVRSFVVAAACSLLVSTAPAAGAAVSSVSSLQEHQKAARCRPGYQHARSSLAVRPPPAYVCHKYVGQLGHALHQLPPVDQCLGRKRRRISRQPESANSPGGCARTASRPSHTSCPGPSSRLASSWILRTVTTSDRQLGRCPPCG